MNEYLQEQHARTQQAIELVKAIASELNKLAESRSMIGPWEFKPLNEDYPTQYIRQIAQPKCEIAFHFWGNSSGSAKGKVDIHGNFHIGRDSNKFVDVREYGLQGYSSLPSIRVTAARGALAIAKEVQRRFLPEYLPLLAKAIAKRDAHEAYADKTRANLLRLAAVVNESVSGLKPDSDRFTVYKDKFYGEVQCSDEKATLTIHDLTIDGAEKILRLVQEKGYRFSDAG